MADQQTPTSATPARWARRLLSGVAALAVLAGGSLYLAAACSSLTRPPGGRP
jgi:hypothetical protein